MRLHERIWTGVQLAVGMVAAIAFAVQRQWLVAAVGIVLVASCWVTNARLGTWIGRALRWLEQR